MPYWRLFYHFVFGTRNREPLIDEPWETDLHNVIAAKAKELGAFVYAMGGVEDHIHLVASVPPRMALATFIGQVKGSSSHFVNHALSLETQFAWQGDYGVVSFGAKHLDTVVRYVRGQRQHHSQGTLIVMLETAVSDASTACGIEPPHSLD